MPKYQCFSKVDTSIRNCRLTVRQNKDGLGFIPLTARSHTTKIQLLPEAKIRNLPITNFSRAVDRMHTQP